MILEAFGIELKALKTVKRKWLLSGLIFIPTPLKWVWTKTWILKCIIGEIMLHKKNENQMSLCVQ